MASSKHAVELGARGLRVDDTFIPLAAGQFEYWRHNPMFWRTILREIKASGIAQVGTFVCWEFHELSRGDFDFTGRTYPSRDLGGFIDMCAEEGLGVLMRIGPYIDAEWPSRGVARDVEQLERLDPHYQLRQREYINALAPVLQPRLASIGGPTFRARPPPPWIRPPGQCKCPTTKSLLWGSIVIGLRADIRVRARLRKAGSVRGWN
jgi:beta-galactosidase